ncbi:hypothetical protein, partial [Candidatus Methylacidithermus pantelleriae]|uniref:hypothetical protein n=1 Tax=Candidatus Methylacidithermus pantelleriae TaxID=2744239 RepID=UPI001BD5BFD1
MKTVQETLTGRSVFRNVAKRKDIWSDPVLAEELRKAQKRRGPEPVVEYLSRKVHVILRPGTRLIEVVAEAGNPKSASLLANAVGEEAI